MNRLHFVLLTLLMLTFSSCDRNDISPNSAVDWRKLRVAVIEKDNVHIDHEVSKLLIDTQPASTDEDEIGQKVNIDKFIREINKSGMLAAELLCYACIDTFPAQTEIELTTTLAGVTVTRVIDISTPDDGTLEYLNIHD